MNSPDNQIRYQANTRLYGQGIPLICTHYALFLAYILFLSFSCYSHDTMHFYRADPFFSEPRFEKPWLASLDIDIGSGHSTTAFNHYGKKVNILDLYELPDSLPEKKNQKGHLTFMK